jgi:2-polyprenyl-3-methyl-5-hydroxy-6-metoxy-1,4-benzoquinol methylase
MLEVVQSEAKQVSNSALDLRATTLLAYLDRVIAEFPPEIIHRGISRNWSDYRYVIHQLSRLVASCPVAPLDYLDLGSGAGVIPSVMALAGLRVTVVDTWSQYAKGFNSLMGNSEEFIARFEKFHMQPIQHNIMQPPLPFPSHSFDLITLFEVMEHLPQPHIVLQEIDRLLRPGGLLVITVPNVANLRNRLRLLIGRSPHADDIENWFTSGFFGHLREMTMDEVRRILSKSGFSTVTTGYSNARQWNTRLPSGRWGKTYQVNSLYQAAKLVYLLVTFIIPSLRYDMFIAARKGANLECH